MSEVNWSIELLNNFNDLDRPLTTLCQLGTIFAVSQIEILCIFQFSAVR